MKLQIPIYSRLSPRHKQYANLIAGGLALMTVALVVSSMIGGGPSVRTGPQDLPKTRPLASVPGAALDPKDAWMGGAGKELAQLKDDLRVRTDEINQLRGDLSQTREALRSQMAALQAGGATQVRPAVLPATESAASAGGNGATSPTGARVLGLPLPTPAPAPATTGTGAAAGAVNAPQAFPAQRSVGLPPGGAAGYPPGTPNQPANPGLAGRGPGQGAAFDDPMPAAPALVRVAVKASSAPATPRAGAADGPVGPAGMRQDPPKQVGRYLPVSFTRAVLLGGLAAPTGGQAQSNPVPVLLRLADLAVLPNGYRSQVKDCLVVGEGFGDHSAERAYIRTTLLSCVLNDGRVLEVPIRGSVFGEDGMNGVMGKLITKQGAILGNALMAGIASGIGGGIASATQTVNSTALGTVTSTPTDTSSILKAGVGNGVSKALDRLAQYYISLAERTFPVIEIQPGRYVDVVLQQGVALDVVVAALGPALAQAPAVRGSSPDADRSGLMRAALTHSDDED